jgi:hypothetical protein
MRTPLAVTPGNLRPRISRITDRDFYPCDPRDPRLQFRAKMQRRSLRRVRKSDRAFWRNEYLDRQTSETEPRDSIAVSIRESL